MNQKNKKCDNECGTRVSFNLQVFAKLKKDTPDRGLQSRYHLESIQFILQIIYQLLIKKIKKTN